MIEAIFFAIARHPEFELGIIFFGSLANRASVKCVLSGCLTLEFALANIRCGPIPQFRVGCRSEEEKIIKERNQNGQFGAQRTSDQWDEQERQAEKGQPFNLQRQNKKD